MVFSSLVFIYVFLPAALILYFISPMRLKNAVLLLVNLLFYGYGEPRYLLLMAGSIIINYLLARVINAAGNRKLKLTFLVLSIVVNLFALGWYKYAGLLTATLRKLPVFTSLPIVSVLLPVGISFYTFQAMSYVIDVYRKDCEPTKNIVDFAAYISLFPQLIAGPIVRYSDVAQQMHHRAITVEKFSYGVRLFCIGLAKKVLLANQFAVLWESVSAEPMAMGTVWAWCGIAAYTLQIYFDFGGYSDMARGLGAMMGFDFCINFDYPYMSSSITEFWRRWHISLSTWFRDYVYIPLGGSRKGTARTVCNLLIVWMLTGFWHGADWTFLLWGLYYGILLLAEKFLLRSVLQRLPRIVRRGYTLLLVMLGWVFFACNDWNSVCSYFRAMFSFEAGADLTQLLCWLPIGLAGAFASVSAGKCIWKKIDHTASAQWAEMVLCVLSLLLCTASLVSGSYNPFLYFRF